MSEKNASEEQITEALNKIITGHEDKAVSLIAKLVFNLRFDLDELKIELYKALTGEEMECEVNHKKEEEDGRFYT